MVFSLSKFGLEWEFTFEAFEFHLVVSLQMIPQFRISFEGLWAHMAIAIVIGPLTISIG